MEIDEMSESDGSFWSSTEESDECYEPLPKKRKQNTQQDDSIFLKFNLEHSWDDLTEESKEEILQTVVKFKDEFLKFKLIFSEHFPPSAEVLNFLSMSKDLQIKPKKAKKFKYFINRRLIRKSNENDRFTVSAEDFIREFQNDDIVLISDLAGSGKTTSLHKIYENLNKFTNFWVCFVSLREHKNLLLDRLQTPQNFLSILTEEILKLNELERKIFEFKYNKNEVVILFDGFDEISPDCKQNALKIFKLHKESGRSQIWITTRKHLELDLEEELDVKACTLEPIKEEEQLKFLTEYWENFCDDSNLRESCAKLLVKKLKEMNERNWGDRTESLIGMTLQLRLLAEYFENELSQDFEVNLNELEFCEVYEILIDKSVNIKEKNSIFNNAKTHMRTYEAYALKFFFGDDEKLNHLFGMETVIEDLPDDVLEEFARGGIIFYDKDKKVFFTHLTYGEFLLSRYVKNKVKNFKEKWGYEKDFFELFEEILYEAKFNVVKNFLNDFFKENFNSSQSSNKYFSKAFNNFIAKNENYSFFNDVAKVVSISEFSFFSFFLINCIKTESIKTFKKAVENLNKSHFFLSTAFDEVRNVKIWEKLLDYIFEVYPENSKLLEFLMQKDEEGKTFLHQYFESKYFNAENFSKFWLKVEEKCFKSDEIVKFFDAKAESEKSFLNYAIEKFSEPMITYGSPKVIDKEGAFFSVFEIVMSIFDVNNQKKLFNDLNLAYLGYLKDDQFKRFFDYFEKLFGPKKFLKHLEEDKSLTGTTIFHIATRWSSPVVVRAIFEKYQELNKKYGDNVEEKLKKFITQKDGNGDNLLMACYENHENFRYLFDEVFKINFDIKELINDVDDDGNNILDCMMRGDDCNFFKEIFSKIIDEYQNYEDIKKLILNKNNEGRNVLMRSCGSYEKFFAILDTCEKFVSFKEFMFEVDNKGQNIFHELAAIGDVATVKEFVNRAQIELSNEELKILLKSKSKILENIFHCLAINHEHPKTIDIIVKLICETFSVEETREILSEVDVYEGLSLHIAAIAVFEKFENFKMLLEVYKIFFSKEELLNILNSKDMDGENVRDRALKGKTQNVTEFIDNILKSF